MNNSMFYKPVLLTLMLMMAFTFYMFPESGYAAFMVDVGNAVSAFMSKLFLAIVMVCLTIVIPVAMMISVSIVLLKIVGRNMYRWSPKSKAGSILGKMMIARLCYHAVGVVGCIVFLMIYAETNSPETREFLSDLHMPALSYFVFIECLYFSFIFFLAGGAIKAAKEYNSGNSSFRVKTTADACWIYSKWNNNTTYRTVLTLNKNFKWEVTRSYTTGEAIDEW